MSPGPGNLITTVGGTAQRHDRWRYGATSRGWRCGLPIRCRGGTAHRTPRAPARACLSLLPSGPGEVHRVGAARGVDRRVYASSELGRPEAGPYPVARRIRLVA